MKAKHFREDLRKILDSIKYIALYELPFHRRKDLEFSEEIDEKVKYAEALRRIFPERGKRILFEASRLYSTIFMNIPGDEDLKARINEGFCNYGLAYLVRK